MDALAKPVLGAAEVIGELPAFKAYYVLGGDDGAVATVSGSNDPSAVQQSVEAATKSVKEDPEGLFSGERGVTIGKVVTHKAAGMA